MWLGYVYECEPVTCIVEVSQENIGVRDIYVHSEVLPLYFIFATTCFVILFHKYLICSARIL